MLIWEHKEYQSQLQEQMEDEARKWFKKKLDESRGIIKADICYD